MTCRALARAAALVLLTLAAGVAEAQVQEARVEGTVVDATGRPVPGAQLLLSDPLGAELRRVVADAAGLFVMPNLVPGRYAISARADGTHAGPVALILTDSLPVAIIVRLPPAFSDTLVVEGGRRAPPVATRTSIAGEALGRMPSRVRQRGLQDAVATLPGWATEDNGLLHSRGTDDGFLFVIDGVPVYERLDQTSGLAPDTTTIDQLTVVTGYVPPEFGHKAGGVIEVRTRAAGGHWRAAASTSAGSDQAWDGTGNAGGRLGETSTLWVGLGGERSSRHLDPVHPDNLHNGGGSMTMAGRFEHARGSSDRIMAGWGAGAASFDVPNTAPQELAGQDQRQRVGQASLTSTWQRVWSWAAVSQLGAYHRTGSARLDGSLRDTPITADADRRLTRTGLLAGLTGQAGPHLLKAGIEIQRLRLSERFDFAVTDRDAAEEAEVSDAALAYDVSNPFRFSGRARPASWAFYVQDSWQASPRVTVAAGLRFDRTQLLLSRRQWSPRAGVAFAATDRTALRVSLGRFYQPPQPENLLLSSSVEARTLSPFAGEASTGGAAIEPERQWALEAGVEHQVMPGVRLDAAYWRRRVREVADPNVFFGTTIIFPNAVARGRADGVDARLEVSPRGSWSGYANLSVGSTTQTGPITGGLFIEDEVGEIGPGVKFVPDHDQRVVASAGVTWAPGGRLAISATARHESGTPTEVDDDDAGDLEELAERPGASLVDFARGRVRPRTIASVVADLRLYETRRASVRLRAAVLNVFDERYAYNFGNPFSGTHFGAPRTFSVGVRVETR